jgi:hypothetical protein
MLIPNPVSIRTCLKSSAIAGQCTDEGREDVVARLEPALGFGPAAASVSESVATTVGYHWSPGALPNGGFWGAWRRVSQIRQMGAARLSPVPALNLRDRCADVTFLKNSHFLVSNCGHNCGQRRLFAATPSDDPFP